MTTTGAPTAQGEQHVVDAGPQRQRHGDEVGHRRGASGRAACPPRSLPMTPSSSVSTPAWRSSTGLGRPVVPDVNCTSATSGRRSVPAARAHVGRRRPRPRTGHRASGCSGDGGEARCGRPRRRSSRGLSGTYTAPARHTPNSAATSSTPFGSMTPTALPGPDAGGGQAGRDAVGPVAHLGPAVLDARRRAPRVRPSRRPRSARTGGRPASRPGASAGRRLPLRARASRRRPAGPRSWSGWPHIDTSSVGARPCRRRSGPSRARPTAPASWPPSPPASSGRSSRPAPGRPPAAARAGRRPR